MRTVALSLAFVALQPTCTPPDQPDSLPSGLPLAALHFLDPELERSAVVGAGVEYRYAEAPRGPWAVYLLRADLERCELGFTVLPARQLPADAVREGRARVTELASAGSSGVIAAVNGDFFSEDGRPLGVEITRGQAEPRNMRATFAWRPGSGPWFGTPRLQGDSLLVLGWPLPLRRADGLSEALSGYPVLLKDGEIVGDLGVSTGPGFAAERHPRTAVAWDAPRRLAWLVVVEGRIDESAGMTLPELTDLLLALGATDALNLDGGGSSAMTIHGRLVSRASDASGERPVANALGLRRDRDFCAAPALP